MRRVLESDGAAPRTAMGAGIFAAHSRHRPTSPEDSEASRDPMDLGHHLQSSSNQMLCDVLLCFAMFGDVLRDYTACACS